MNRRKRTKLLRRLRTAQQLLDGVVTWYFSSAHFDARGSLSLFFKGMEEVIIKSGPQEIVDTIKPLRTKFVGSLSDLSSFEFPTGFTPSLIERLKIGDTVAIQWAMTLLMVSRMFRKSGLPSFESITAPQARNEFDILAFFDGVSANDLMGGLELPNPGLHFSSKSGPKGPAMLTSLADIETLDERLGSSITTLRPEISTKMDDAASFILTPLGAKAKDLGVKSARAKGIRAIAIRNDREMKLRPFAILDYGSQEALIPLHQAIFERLKLGSTDFTFSQLEGVEYLKGLKPRMGDNSYHSLDLTAATDRFPISVQVAILAHLIGQEKAMAGYDIMVGRPFHVINQDISISYRVGQPMGAYSSGGVFTLVHHYLVRYAANDIRFNQYAILGDDIVIANDQVADRYTQLLYEMGVEISKPKTIVSKDTFEFAKRLIHKSHEVSGFPISAFMDTWKIPTLAVLTLANEIHSRGLGPRYGLVNKKMVFSLYQDWDPVKLGTASYDKRDTFGKHGQRAARYPFGGQHPDVDARQFMKLSGFNISCNLREGILMKLCEEYTATLIANKAIDSLRESHARFVATVTGSALVDSDRVALSKTDIGENRAELLRIPLLQANRDLVVDYQSYYEQYRAGASQENFRAIIDNPIPCWIAEPVQLLAGNRNGAVVGRHGRLIAELSTFIKNAMKQQQDILADPNWKGDDTEENQ